MNHYVMNCKIAVELVNFVNDINFDLYSDSIISDLLEKASQFSVPLL